MEAVLLATVIILLLVLLVETIHRMTSKPIVEVCKLHDWWEVVNDKQETIGLICARCKQVPRIEE